MEPFDPNNPEHRDKTKYKIVKLGTVFEHTMIALDSVPMEKRRLDIMLAVLTHDFGKAVVETSTEEDGDIVHFFGHAEEGEAVIRKFLSRFMGEEGFKGITDTVVALAAYHMQPYQMKKDLNKRQLRRLALKVNIDDLITVHMADMAGRPTDTSHVDRIITMYGEIKNEIKPFLTGKHLIAAGMQPSKDFGGILKRAFEAQLDGAFGTAEAGIDWLKDEKIIPEAWMQRIIRKIKKIGKLIQDGLAS